ncbi:MAG TPA: sugar transferase [Gemmatimonadales bacterium]|nr:sugar transferase [Gemmatimonadales bacterium]
MTLALRSVERRQPLLDVLLPRTRVCRLLNVIVAAIGLVGALPLMLVIAATIWLTSGSPVIFTQTRIGIDRRGRPRRSSGNGRRSDDLGGRPFTIYKFRTMDPRGGSGTAQTWARPADRRVGVLGRILRTLRLDELPQLVNVLIGDMNIVGPRPEQPAIFARLRHEIQGYALRQRVPPGITGWAQINQGYDRSLADVRRKVALDLEYIEHRSPLADLAIMVKTIPVMLFGRGAI